MSNQSLLSSTTAIAADQPPSSPSGSSSSYHVENREKGIHLSAKAKGMVTGFKLFGKRYDEAADLYERAANHFKVAKEWSLAGEAFCDAANCHLKTDAPSMIGSTYTDAGRCFTQSGDHLRAMECFTQAIEWLENQGRFANAAVVRSYLADAHEAVGEMEQAMVLLQQAADYYAGENQHATANPHLLNVARLAAIVKDWEKAARVFEEVAENSLRNNCLKHGVSGCLFKAGLCRFMVQADVPLAVDMSSRADHLNKYEDMAVSFSDSKEWTLLCLIMDAFEKKDVEIFATAVSEYNRVCPLDSWKVDVLLAIRKNLESVCDKDDHDALL
jgi:alpha-soluble NSF attachment protein